jgi:hypothetical protein
MTIETSKLNIRNIKSQYLQHQKRAEKLLVIIYQKCGRKPVATTLTVDELFSKLKSAEVDRGVTAKIESPTDSHSLTLVGGSGGRTHTNPSSKMYSLSSLMSLPDEEFDMLGEDELVFLT